MYVYYRVSDKGNPKEKLPFADKIGCLKNAIAEFGKESMYVIADNCARATVGFLRENGIMHEETSLGNAGSFVHMLNKIRSERLPDDIVYLLEDDYVHLPGSKEMLIEGLEIADYVTLYDHPDKYRLAGAGGNTLNAKKLRRVRVYLSRTHHWRETDSTTMTFACRVKTLLEDFPVWDRHCRKKSPDDFHAFMELIEIRLSDLLPLLKEYPKRRLLILLRKIFFRRPSRLLVSAIPAMSTHAEMNWLSPVIDWKAAMN